MSYRFFIPQPDGSIQIRRRKEEREFFKSLAEQIRDLLMGSVVDDDAEMLPPLRRLFPVAYANDPQRQEDYKNLTRDDLLNKRLEQLQVLDKCADSEVIAPDEVAEFLAGLNSVRLVLGTILDVSEEDDPDELFAQAVANEDDVSVEEFVVLQFHYLGTVLGDLVDAADGAMRLKQQASE